MHNTVQDCTPLIFNKFSQRFYNISRSCPNTIPKICTPLPWPTISIHCTIPTLEMYCWKISTACSCYRPTSKHKLQVEAYRLCLNIFLNIFLPKLYATVGCVMDNQPHRLHPYSIAPEKQAYSPKQLVLKHAHPGRPAPPCFCTSYLFFLMQILLTINSNFATRAVVPSNSQASSLNTVKTQHTSKSIQINIAVVQCNDKNRVHVVISHHTSRRG